MDDAWRYIFQCVYYVSTYKAIHRLWSYSNFYCIVCQRQLSFLYCFWPKQTRWLISNCIIVNTLHVWDYFVKSNLSLLVTTVTWSVTVSTIGFYPHDAMLARVCATATCLSVRLSVTSRYCVKTKKASVMISSTSGSPTILVFWCQISSQHSKPPPRAEASNKRGMGKISSFLSLSLYTSKTVADTAKVTIND